MRVRARLLLQGMRTGSGSERGVAVGLGEGDASESLSSELLGGDWALKRGPMELRVMGDATVGANSRVETEPTEAIVSGAPASDLFGAIGRASGKVLADDDALSDLAKKAVRRTAASEIGKKPEVTVIVSRLS